MRYRPINWLTDTAWYRDGRTHLKRFDFLLFTFLIPIFNPTQQACIKLSKIKGFGDGEENQREEKEDFTLLTVPKDSTWLRQHYVTLLWQYSYHIYTLKGRKSEIFLPVSSMPRENCYPHISCWAISCWVWRWNWRRNHQGRFTEEVKKGTGVITVVGSLSSAPRVTNLCPALGRFFSSGTGCWILFWRLEIQKYCGLLAGMEWMILMIWL